MPEKPSHGLHYYVLPDDPLAALNILREAAGLEPWAAHGTEPMNNVSLADARRLLNTITDCGVTPPQSLAELVGAHDAIAHSGALTEPVTDLIRSVVGGKLRGVALDKQIAQAAAAQQAAEFRRGLTERAEPAVMDAFIAALQAGAADDVIESVTVQFDTAAAALVECAELIDPNADPEQFLAGTDETGRQAWRAIKPNVETLIKLGSLVVQFGTKSLTFSLIELPAQLGGTGFLSDYELMCVDPRYGIERPSVIFNQPGVHRQSPWYRAAPMLRLNTIEQATEKLRAWSEAAWDRLDLNKGRGRMEGKTFIPMPIANPFAQNEQAT